MAFLAPIAAAGIGYLGQQQANNASINAQQNAQNQAQAFQQQQLGNAKNYQQQALQQALQNLAQYQQQNPAPISQLGAIQQPGQAQGQPQQSFGGGVAQMQPPDGMQRPQMPQQNLQGAMQGPPPGAMQQPQQPQGEQFPRLQQLYPLMQQMLAGNRSQTMPMGRRSQGIG
jgi:hypothetical protein